MVCGMKEYLKQSLEVWGHLNWTLFPLREALGFHAHLNVTVDFLVDNPVEQRQAGFCSSLFQQWPIQVLQHACDTLMSAVLVAYETGCSTLNCFQELNVVLCVWIPYWSCVFHLGPEDRLVSHILYLSRAVFEASTQDSQVLDLPLRQSSSHGCSTVDLMTIQLQGRLCCLLAVELHAKFVFIQQLFLLCMSGSHNVAFPGIKSQLPLLFPLVLLIKVILQNFTVLTVLYGLH